MDQMQNLPFVSRDIWKNVLVLLFVITVLVLFFYYFDIQAIRTYIENAGPIAPILYILAKASTIVIAPIGGAPLYPIAGSLFGFWKGAAVLILGDMLGGIISFYLARFFGRPLVERLLGDSRGLLSRALDLMSTAKGYFIARIGFISLPELASYGAGLTKIGFLPFITIYTVIGAIPSIVIAGIGDIVTEAGNETAVPFVMLGSIILSGITLTIFLAVLNRYKKDDPVLEDAPSK